MAMSVQTVIYNCLMIFIQDVFLARSNKTLYFTLNKALIKEQLRINGLSSALL